MYNELMFNMLKNCSRKCISAVMITCIIATALALCTCLSGCSQSTNTTGGLRKSTVYTSLSDVDFTNKKIGCVTGTVFEQIIAEKYPSANVVYYSNHNDLIAALESGKVDLIGEDELVMSYMATQTDNLFYIDCPLFLTDIGFAFAKTEKGLALREQFNKFLDALEESGDLEILKTKWLEGIVIDDTVDDYTSLPAINGTLTFASEFCIAPFDYKSDNHLAGFEVELAVQFCKQYGYGMEIIEGSFTEVLEAVASGKCDFVANDISITPERAENMYFSNLVVQTEAVLVYRSKEEAASIDKTITSVEELSGKRVGVLVGSSITQNAEQVVGKKGRVLYFNNNADLPVALNAGKIDAYINDKSITLPLLSQYPNQVMLDETLSEFECGFILNKDSAEASGIRAQLNEYIEKCKTDGTISSLESKWMVSTDESKKVVDYPAEGNVRTLKVAVATSVGEPHVYLKDNKLVGFDIDILSGFAKEYGYGLEFTDMDFTGVLASVSQGMSDIGASGIIKSPEREQTMMFTIGYYDNSAVCVVGGDDVSSGFFESVANGLEKTFLRESRWKLFAVGIIHTLIITLFALVLGTALGFAVFLACRNGGRIVNTFTRFCVWLINGMPTVVLLMVLFYLVFGSTSLGGVGVSIIAFSLIFASAVIGMLKTGVGAVDPGQEEAARAMGFSRNQAFMEIILPQAIMHVTNIYESEMVTMLKGTAVVGYIAVQDVTKVGDVIRSRTYEAFFPLIATAVVYFVLAAILKVLVRHIARKINPRNRSEADILKGVNVK